MNSKEHVMKLRNCRLITLVFIMLFPFTAATLGQASNLKQKAKETLGFAARQIEETARQGKEGMFARTTEPDGSWRWVKPNDWTSGFFPGLLWFLHESSGKKELRQWAEKWTAGLEEQKLNTRTHDVGFILNSSFGNGLRITGRKEYREVLLTGANSLATRFNPRVGCIRSWDHGTWSFPVIVDNMMNLELLFWAAKNGGDTKLREIAVSHALKTLAEHVRPDGGTFHVVDYNPETGAVKQKKTHQGFRDDSTWARGQAWGIYGFTVCFRETGDKRFLDAAVKLADYFLARLPADSVPYWDFQVPNVPQEPRDSSAGAIAASGLLELATLVPESAARDRYRQAAEKILGSLCSDEYLTRGTNIRSILRHATGSKPANSEVDVALIYGDYYFVEALLRYLHPKRIPKPVVAR
jgi:unsaturated chondroitin disaccharide hydrolase